MKINEKNSNNNNTFVREKKSFKFFGLKRRTQTYFTFLCVYLYIYSCSLLVILLSFSTNRRGEELHTYDIIVLNIILICMHAYTCNIANGVAHEICSVVSRLEKVHQPVSRFLHRHFMYSKYLLCIVYMHSICSAFVGRLQLLLLTCFIYASCMNYIRPSSEIS